MISCPNPVAVSTEALEAPLITVAICTRNRAAFLEMAVRSVLAQIQDDTELLIVDNGSTDRTAELVRQFASSHPRVGYLHEARTGLSIARNTVLLHARGKYVLFLDDDATVQPGWLAAYQNFLKAPPAPNIAVVAGAVHPRYELPPPAWLSPNENKYDLGDKPFCLKRQDSPWEGNCAYARSLAIEHGLFDPRLGHRGDRVGAHEGADLNMRLQTAGHEIWWLPGVTILHTIHASRVNLHWYCRSAFAAGGAAALKRLKVARGPGRRFSLRAGRLAATPFHVLINLGVSLFWLALGRPVTAVTTLRRAMRTVGYDWQLLKPLAQ